MHDRQNDHFGTQLDTVVVLDGPIGRYVSGTDLHTVLVDLVARITAVESTARVISRFAVDAFIAPCFRLDAVIFRAGSAATFSLDARVAGGASFTLNSLLTRPSSASFTLAAYFIDDVQA